MSTEPWYRTAHLPAVIVASTGFLLFVTCLAAVLLCLKGALLARLSEPRASLIGGMGVVFTG